MHLGVASGLPGSIKSTLDTAEVGGGACGTLEINNLNRGNNLKLYFSFDNLWHVGEALSPVVGWPHLNSIYTLWDAEVLHVSASFPIFLPLPSPATAHHI